MQVDANHRGRVQFRICVAPEKGDPSKDCFEKNKLKFENGQDEVDLWSVVPVQQKFGSELGQIFKYKVQLPRNLTCKHCLFQFWWNGNLNSQLYISKFI